MATAKKAAKKANSNKGTRVAGSMADQIDRLEVGKTIAVAERLEIGAAGTDEEGIKTALHKLRSGMAAYVVRVVDGDLDTREFKTESGTYLTDDKTAIVVSCTTTRLQ